MLSLVSIEQQSPRRLCDSATPASSDYFRFNCIFDIYYNFSFCRYLGVAQSLDKPNLSSLKAARVHLVSVVTIAFLVEIARLFEYRIQEMSRSNSTLMFPLTTGLAEDDVYQILYRTIIYASIRRYIPLFVTSILTYHLVKFLLEKRKIRKTILRGGIHIHGNEADILKDYITMVLTVIALVYVVCLLPGAMYPIIRLFVATEPCYSFFVYLATTADTLAILNSSLNFFIYYLNIPVFKKSLKKMVPKCYIRQKAKDCYVVQSTRM